MMGKMQFLIAIMTMTSVIHSTYGAPCVSTDLSYTILIDSSSSVLTNQPDEWTFEKIFVKNFAVQTSLGTQGSVRIGLVNYGQVAVTVANCASSGTTNLANFNSLIDSLVRQEGGTAIHFALQRADEILSGNGCGRAGEKDLVLLITDGTENVVTDTAAITALENKLRGQAAIQVLSVGGGTNIPALERLTGQSSYVKRYNSWEDLSLDNATDLWLQFASRVCEVGGRWAQWGAWGACSISCGDVNGITTRTRKCMNPITNVEQTDCTDYPPGGTESTSCNLGHCDGTLTQWSAYSTCTETCQSNLNTSPTQTRTRQCNGATGPGNCLNVILTQTINCNVNVPCPGNWQSWGQYGSCSETCQSNVNVAPTQSRSRSCTGDTFGGGCAGSSTDSQACNSQIGCPGFLTQWSGYGACATTCQITNIAPIQTRTRQCQGATFNLNCNGAALTESQDCNTAVQCPGDLSQWTAFGACSATCQANSNTNPTRTRTRTCTNFSFGGNCNGTSLTANGNCNVGVGCKGNWGTWGAYATCSQTCQSNTNLPATQTRTRVCIGATFNAGCDGSASQTINCNVNVACQGTLTQWSGYGTCSASCQLGISAPKQSRTRQCVGSTFGGNCNGELLTSTRDCSIEVQCPGDLSQWAAYGACSAVCQNDVNNAPTRTRTRTCSNVSFGGNCFGASLTETATCNSGVGCKGNWGAWGAYATCSQTCQSNTNLSPTQTRTRVCIGATFNAGCDGSASQTINCNANVACQGNLGQWSGYGACSASCQLAISAPNQKRTRTCTGSTFGGNCGGAVVEETRDCNVEVQCPGDLSQWTQWTACPLTCQSGNTAPKQFRSRTCTQTSFGGNCNAAVLSGERTCVANVPCPGILTQWSSWSQCSATCQQDANVAPTYSRTRLCQTATLGGNCGGLPLAETGTCNAAVGCPGTLGQWGPWSTCTESCQSNPAQPPGQSRIRFCLGSSFGNNCNGATLRADRNCNTAVICPVPATWNAWTEWTTCSKTCDQGTQKRTRTCNLGIPAGTYCDGDAEETRNCTVTECPKICKISKRCTCDAETQYQTAPAIESFQITTTEIHNAANVLAYWTETIQNQLCESCSIQRLTTSVNTVTQHMTQLKNVKDRLLVIKNRLKGVINCNSQTTITTNLWALYDWVWMRCVMLDGISVELAAIKMRFDAALNACNHSNGWFHMFFKHMYRKS